jgi:hypothetical protein
MEERIMVSHAPIHPADDLRSGAIGVLSLATLDTDVHVDCLADSSEPPDWPEHALPGVMFLLTNHAANEFLNHILSGLLMPGPVAHGVILWIYRVQVWDSMQQRMMIHLASVHATLPTGGRAERGVVFHTQTKATGIFRGRLFSLLQIQYQELRAVSQTVPVHE